MNFKRVSVFVLVLIMAMSMVAFAAETKVTILHTNDMHGRLAGFVPRGEENEIGGFARIATLIRDICTFEENVILLDAGDTVHGTNLVNFTEGIDMIQLLNYIGYDAMVPGNHDFNYGYKHLEDLVKFAKFKVVSANVEKDGTSLFAKYTILERDGYRFAIVGLSAPETVIMTHPANVVGLDFLDPIVTTKSLVDSLKSSVDFVIVLSHLGYSKDKVLAESVSGIDVIIGGHSHTAIAKPELVNNVIIAQTGEYTKNLGRVNLIIEDGKIVDYNGELIPVVYTIPKEPIVNAIVKTFENKLLNVMGEIVGASIVDLIGDRANVRTEETNMGNLITDIMLANCDADLVMTNGGGIRASIAKGDITINDIYTVLPFDNTLVVLELTGAQIKAALEHAVRKYPEQNGGFLHVSGMTYTFDPAKATGERVVDVMVNYAELDLNQTYQVATNDFVAAGGDGYSMFKEGSIVYESGLYLRDLMVSYLKEYSFVEPKVEGRIVCK